VDTRFTPPSVHTPQAEKELHALMKAHGVSAFDPMYTAVGAFGQFPVWMTFFFTIQVRALLIDWLID
jgi:hypothetical protein